MRLRFPQVSNIRLRPSPQADIGAASVKRIPPYRMGAKMSKQCPKCGATDMVKASLAHEAGTSDIQSVTVGAGIGGGGLGVGAAKSKGTSQSLLAQRTAPPAMDGKSFSGCATLILLLSLAALHWNWPGWVWIVSVVLVIPMGTMMLWQDLQKHGEDQKKYDRSWLCQRCGTISDLGR